MAMSRFMSAFIVVMISVVSLYVFSITYGAVLDQMYANFVVLQPSLGLSPAWDAIATKTLTYWGLLWRSITVIVISLFLWAVRVALIDIDYTRPE